MTSGIGIIMGVGKPMVFRSWVMAAITHDPGMGMVSTILNLCYTIPIPIPMVSWVVMGSTLKCSFSVEDESFPSQTWNPFVIYDIFIVPNSHSKWFSHHA
jgi:hypothetical protein